jgi:glycosyltransferase involved in cell wall biosynthesis
MNKPVISVVMVVCNVERYLAEAIESILGQTFKEFEFVIVDFGSTDETTAIVSSWAAKDRRIKFHAIPSCRLTKARNASCSIAQGKYLAVMDADDIALGDRLALQLRFMERHPGVGIVGGGVEWITASGKSLLISRYPTEDRAIQTALLEQSAIWHPTAFFRRDAFDTAGGYRPAFAQAEDYDLFLRIAERFQIANLNEIVLKYRIHPHQLSLDKRREQSLCVLAAQASALSRRNGHGDPINSLEEITSAAVAGLGVSETTQSAIVVRYYLGWLKGVYLAGEYSAALDTAIEVLRSPDRVHAEKWVIAEMRFLVARIYWRQRRYVRSVASVGRAILERPVVLGHFLKLLLHWLRLAFRTGTGAQAGAVSQS